MVSLRQLLELKQRCSNNSLSVIFGEARGLYLYRSTTRLSAVILSQSPRPNSYTNSIKPQSSSIQTTSRIDGQSKPAPRPDMPTKNGVPSDEVYILMMVDFISTLLTSVQQLLQFNITASLSISFFMCVNKIARDTPHYPLYLSFHRLYTIDAVAPIISS